MRIGVLYSSRTNRGPPLKLTHINHIRPQKCRQLSLQPEMELSGRIASRSEMLLITKLTNWSNDSSKYSSVNSKSLRRCKYRASQENFLKSNLNPRSTNIRNRSLTRLMKSLDYPFIKDANRSSLKKRKSVKIGKWS